MENGQPFSSEHQSLQLPEGRDVECSFTMILWQSGHSSFQVCRTTLACLGAACEIQVAT